MIRSFSEKALAINLDSKIYGTFAEIGAGQEVARHFFQAGLASQTVAKSISAYDMTFSDEIYGREPSGRYVCEARLTKMLNHEYNLLLDRLGKKRGLETQFFSFASTVATSSSASKQPNGWIGVRFQTSPNTASNDIILHVRLKDNSRLEQQDLLGQLGVNLLYAAYFHCHELSEFLNSLTEDLDTNRVALDLLQVRGPLEDNLPSALLNLEMVRRGYCEAVLFGSQGEILNCGEALFRKSLYLMRGAYRPVTITNMEVAVKGYKQFQKDFDLPEEMARLLFEISMHDKTAPNLDNLDFWNRVEILNSLGQDVLVTNFDYFYELTQFLRNFTTESIALPVSVSFLEKIFKDSFYTNLSGGILSAFGHLFDGKTILYIFPQKEKGKTINLRDFKLPEPINFVYNYLLKLNFLRELLNGDELEFTLKSKDIRKKLLSQDPSWEAGVPQGVISKIKAKKLFGFVS